MVQRNKLLVFKAGVWFTFCSILQRGIQFLITPIYTRLLLPEGYGKYSTFITWCNLFSIITTFSLSSGVFYKAMSKFHDTKDDYYQSMVGLSFILTIVSLFFYSLLYPIISKIVQLSVPMSICMYITIFFQMTIQLWMAKTRYEYNHIKLFLVTLVYSLLTPIVSVLLFCFVIDSEIALIIGFLFANVIVGLLLIVLTVRKEKVVNKCFWKYALNFNIPLVPHYLSNVVLGQSDRIMISRFCGNYYTGIYTLTYQIALIISIVSNGIDSAVTPWIYENIKQNRFWAIKKMIHWLMLFGLLPMVMLLMIAPELVKIMGSVEFGEALYTIPPVTIGAYLMYINIFLVGILFYFEKNVNVMISTSIGAVVNILLNYLLIPKFGYIVAAYTTFVGYLIIYFINYTWLYYKLQNIYKEIFSVGSVFLCIGFSVLAAGFSLYLYNTSFIFRYMILLICFIIMLSVFLIKRNVIFKSGDKNG